MEGPVRERIADRYEVLAWVGTGGMGAVYKVKDTQLDEVVALKLIRSDLGDDSSGVERFRSEVKLARRVTHKNVARVFDIGDHEGRPFLTMELVNGTPLDEHMARRPGWSLREATCLTRSVLAGLAAAHEAGVVHRDLKPANIIVEHGGRVVITDFGIAKPVQADGARHTLGARFIVGTPAYMAPEQVEATDVDPRADLFAVGVILFELLTGRLPFRGDTPIALAASRLTTPPLDPCAIVPSLPKSLADVLHKTLARRPEDRFQTASALAEALAGLDDSDAPVVRPEGNPSHMVTAETEVALSLPPPARAASPLDPVQRTLAVIPLENLGSAEDESLVRGLSEDIRDALSTIPGLRVCSTMPTRTDGDLARAAREQSVDVCVLGNVRRSGGRARVSLRLQSPEDGILIWARRFDSPSEETLLIGDQAAEAIAAALALRHEQPSRHESADPVAIELYLRARGMYQRSWTADIDQSVQLFEAAAERAPDNHAIVAGLALARARMWFFRAVGKEEAVRATERAIALAPESAEARLARASLSFHLADEATAITEGLAVVRRAPGLSEGHVLVGRILCEIGRVEDGIQFLQRALMLDPTQEYARREFSRTLALLGRWKDAELLLDDVDGPSLVPSSRTLARGRMAFWRRDLPGVQTLAKTVAGIDLADDARPMHDSEAIASAIQHVMEQAGSLNERGQQALAKPTDNIRRRIFFAQLAAEIGAFQGDDDACIHQLERADEAGLIDLLWLERCPLLDSVRGAPRYREALRRVRGRAAAVASSYDATARNT